jgi:hypothetical protein
MAALGGAGGRTTNPPCYGRRPKGLFRSYRTGHSDYHGHWPERATKPRSIPKAVLKSGPLNGVKPILWR